MDKIRAVRSLVADRLAAAAEEIFSEVERMVTEKMLHTSEISPEEQRAAVRKRLQEVADEIIRIYETLVAEVEADASLSKQENECRCRLNITSKTETRARRRKKMQGQKCLEAPREADSEFIHGEASCFQTQKEEKSPKVEERCGMAAEQELESNQRRSVRRKNPRLDCHKMLGRTRCKGAAGKKVRRKQREGENDESWRKSEGSDDEAKEQRKTKPKAEHKRSEDDDSSHLKYGCKVCSKTFCYRASFLKHVQNDETETDLCGVCGKHFESEENLRLHLQKYFKTSDCKVCGKHFDGHKQLEMHMRTHTGEKPFVCSVCGKAFAQNGNLMGHMRVHTGEKPYVCSVCGQSFSFKEYMMAHMRIHTGEKPFLCSVCGKGFRQRGTLKTHMMIHTGESTHRCGVCDKKFCKSGALKIHMRAHTGEKPYLCNVCGKSFSAGGSLTKHMGAHEGEQKHRCSICGERFLRRDDLQGHAQTHREESDQLSGP